MICDPFDWHKLIRMVWYYTALHRAISDEWALIHETLYMAARDVSSSAPAPLVDSRHGLPRNVELPAELAGVGDAHREGGLGGDSIDFFGPKNDPNTGPKCQFWTFWATFLAVFTAVRSSVPNSIGQKKAQVYWIASLAPDRDLPRVQEPPRLDGLLSDQPREHSAGIGPRDAVGRGGLLIDRAEMRYAHIDIEVSGKLLLPTILKIKFTVGADIIPLDMALIQ